MRYCRFLGLILLTGALVACGFHLRGSYQLSEQLSPVFVDKDSMSLELYRELRSTLLASDVELADDAVAASSVLKVNKEQRARDVISVDTLGRAREYRLIYRLTFSLQQDGENIIENSNIQITRNLLFDPEVVLGVAIEAENFYRAMIRDSTSQVMFRLQAIK